MADNSSTLILDGQQPEEVLRRILTAMKAVDRSYQLLSTEFKTTGLKLGDQTFKDLNQVIGHLTRTNKALSQMDRMLNQVNRAQRATNEIAALEERARKSTNRELRIKLRLEAEELRLKQLQRDANGKLTREIEMQIGKIDRLLSLQMKIRQQMELQRSLARQTAAAQAKVNNPQFVQSQAAVGNRMAQERISGAFSGDTFRLQARLMANYLVLSQISEALRFAARFVVDFDRALFDLQAITASTNTEMTAFRDNIVEVANSTKFTAVEVAEAARTLAQAGFSVQQVAEALAGVSRFASATGTTMQEAVDIMSSAISVFNLRAAEATNIANLFTAAINNSKLSQDKLSQSFTYVANTASQSGVSITELTAILGGLANAGIRTGSTIGTNLRALMIALQAPTDELREKLLRMGISLRDVDLSANGVIGVIENLSDAGFTAADGFEVFEVRAANAFAALLGQRDSLRDLEGDIQGTTAAFEASDIQMRSLANTFSNTQSIFGSFLQEALAPLTRGLQAVLQSLNEFMAGLSENKILVQAFGHLITAGLVTGTVALLAQITRLAPAVGGLATAFTAAGGGATVMGTGMGAAAVGARVLGGALRFMLGPIGLISLAIGGLITVIGYLNGRHAEAEERLDEMTASTNAATGAYDEQRQVLHSIGDEMTSLINQQRQLAGEDGTDALSNRVAQLEERFGDLGLTLDDVASSYAGVLQRMSEFEATRLGDIVNSVRDQTVALRAEIEALEDAARSRRGRLLSNGARGELDDLSNSLGLNRLTGLRDNGTGSQSNRASYQEAGLGNLFELQYRRERNMTIRDGLVQQAYAELQELSVEQRETIGTLLENMESFSSALEEIESKTREAAESENLERVIRDGTPGALAFASTVRESDRLAETIADLMADPNMAQNSILTDRAMGSGINLGEQSFFGDLDGEVLQRLRDAGVLSADGMLVPLEVVLENMSRGLQAEWEGLTDEQRQVARDQLSAYNELVEVQAETTALVLDAQQRAAQNSRGVFQLRSSRARQRYSEVSQMVGDVRNRSELDALRGGYGAAVQSEARARLGSNLNRELELTPDQIDRLFREAAGDFSFAALREAAGNTGLELLADDLTLLQLATEETGDFIQNRMTQLVEQERRITDIERRVSLQTQQREIRAAREERDRFLAFTPEGTGAEATGSRYESAVSMLQDIQSREMARLQRELSDLRVNDLEAEERIAAMRQQHETEMSQELRAREEAIRQARLMELDLIRQQQELILDFNRDLTDPAGETRMDMLGRQTVALEALNDIFANEMEALLTELEGADPVYRKRQLDLLQQEQEERRRRFDEEQRGQRQDGAPISGFEEFWEAVRERTGRGLPGQSEVEEATYSVPNTALDAFLVGVEKARSATATFFQDVLTGQVSAGEGFRALGVTILESMLDVITSRIAEQFVNLFLDALPTFGGGGGGGGTSKIKLPGKREGGHLGFRRMSGGGPSTRDYYPILGQEGEFVLRKSAVSALGSDRVRKMNALGNRAISEGRPAPLGRGPVDRDTINVYVLPPEEQPVPGPKDMVVAITDDMRRNGATAKLIKQIQTGNG